MGPSLRAGEGCRGCLSPLRCLAANPAKMVAALWRARACRTSFPFAPPPTLTEAEGLCSAAQSDSNASTEAPIGSPTHSERAQAIIRDLPRSAAFHELTLAHADGSYTRLLQHFAKADVLVIDDWGLAAPKENERRDLLKSSKTAMKIGPLSSPASHCEVA